MTVIKVDAIFSPDEGFLKFNTLVLNGGIITEMTDACTPGRKDEVLDLSGCVISPPFCDYHLHFSKDALPLASGITRALHESGIVEVFEGGDRDLSGIEMKKTMGERLMVRTSGLALHKAGGYGKTIGAGVGDVAEARAMIDRLHALGADYIKIINSGVFMPESGEISQGGFEKNEIREITEYAVERGLPVVCHANGDGPIRDAVRAGVSAIVHGFSISDETLAMMAVKKVDFIPTVNALYNLTRVYGSTDERKRIEKLTEEHLAAVRRAKDCGVRILPGSDAGPSFLPYGSSYLDELRFFAKAGLEVDKILSSSVTGLLRTGSAAHFLVLKGLSVEKVFIRGECIC